MQSWTRATTPVCFICLVGPYAVAEPAVQQEDWLSDKTLRDLRLPEEGGVVLEFTKQDGRYIGAPRGGSRIEPGDVVLL